MMNEKILEISGTVPMVRECSCCGVENKFCDGDKWLGNLGLFARRIIQEAHVALWQDLTPECEPIEGDYVLLQMKSHKNIPIIGWHVYDIDQGRDIWREEGGDELSRDDVLRWRPIGSLPD